MKTTTVVPVRMPIALKERIGELAQKGLTTRNHWIVRALIYRSEPSQTARVRRAAKRLS